MLVVFSKYYRVSHVDCYFNEAYLLLVVAVIFMTMIFMAIYQTCTDLSGP